MNCLSVFDHFMGLVLKELTATSNVFIIGDQIVMYGIKNVLNSH